MQLPEITIQPTELLSIQYGTIRSWLLVTAVEFKVFNLTVDGKNAKEIAASLKTHEKNTELYLNALCSIGLLQKDESVYTNTGLSNTYLVEGSETYIGGILQVNEQWNIQSKEQMKNLVENGPPPPKEEHDFSGDYFADHIKAMRNFARSGNSQLVATEIGRLLEFPGMKRMLELGGGHGMDCMAVVAKHPGLQGIVFDKPAVVEVTKEIITEYKMEERVSVMGGDYGIDSIGGGYDLIYAKATINFFKDNLDPLFTKIYEALNPGGVFISIHDGLTEENTQPADMVISWISTGLSSFDFSFSRDAIPRALLEAGFKSVQTKPHYFPMGTLDMNIGRK
jgi:predicted O-methyltransferase YrrM